MRIAVISDSHDCLPPGLAARLRGCDEIWHLGDVCDPTTLAELELLGVPLQVVRGNCDGNFAWPTERTLERAGARFHLVHIPPPRAPRGVHALLHGHTHIPRDEVAGGVRWLNPGSVSRPRGSRPGFAWLTVEAGGEWQWTAVAL